MMAIKNHVRFSDEAIDLEFLSFPSGYRFLASTNSFCFSIHYVAIIGHVGKRLEGLAGLGCSP